MRAVPHPLHRRANKCGRQHDEILQVSISTVVAFDDNEALQTDYGNKNPCGKELQKNDDNKTLQTDDGNKIPCRKELQKNSKAR
jgi:hypothetical protein